MKFLRSETRAMRPRKSWKMPEAEEKKNLPVTILRICICEIINPLNVSVTLR